MKDTSKQLAMASDHGGFAMKEFIKVKLLELGFNVKDYGTFSEDSVDYPDMIHPLAKAINDGEIEKAIIMCGSGNGAQMVANKYPNVRAGLCWTDEQAKLTRMHNDANIMSLPGRFVEFEDAWEMSLTFLRTKFEGGRHLVRVEKINKTL